MEWLKFNSDRLGGNSIPLPLQTLVSLRRYFTFFVSHAKTRKTRFHNHLVVFVLTPRTIFSPNRSYLHILHFSYSYPFSSCSFWFSMVILIENCFRFLYKLSGHSFTKSLSENIWFSKIMTLLNKIEYVHLLIYMWITRLRAHNLKDRSCFSQNV